MAGLTARMKELFSKYGKVAVAVHLSVSAVSFTGFYVAITRNLDVGPVLEKVGLIGAKEAQDVSKKVVHTEGFPGSSSSSEQGQPKGDSTGREEGSSAAAAATGGAFVLAALCNKALLPVRVPLTVALTPPVARFLARRKLYRSV